MRKHVLFLLLVFCFVLGFAPATAHAEEGEKLGGSYNYIIGTTEGTSSTEVPNCLIDGETDTKWCVTNFENAFIIFETKSAVTVNGYVITTGGDNSGNPGRNPKSWTLYGCNDYNPETSIGNWKEIHEVTNDTVLEDENYTDYYFDFEGNSQAYKYYKLEITAIQGGNVMQMSEFELTYCEKHNWKLSKKINRGCSTEGYTEKKCSVCGHTKITERQSPLGHNFDENGKCIRCEKTRKELYTFDIKDGKIEIRDDINGRIKVRYVSGGNVIYSENYINPAETITVTGTTTENELHVYAKTSVKIKAENLNINTSGKNIGAYAFLVAVTDNKANVTLILEGNNSFIGEKAGITVDAGRSLTIEGEGSLSADGSWGGAAGIGGEESGHAGGNITIQGNVKISAGIIGDGSGASGSTFTIGEGNPIIIASSISDQTGKKEGNWKGLIFEGGQGKIYGPTFTLSSNFTVEAGKTLEIGEGQSLVIPKGITLTNEGTIVNKGKLGVLVGASFENTEAGTFVDGKNQSIPIEDVKKYYPLTVNDGSAEGDVISNNGKLYAKEGSEVTLKYTVPTGYKFLNWTSEPKDVEITNSSFKMPASGVTVTANMEKIPETNNNSGTNKTPEANKAPESTNIPAQSTTALRLQGTAAKTSIKMKWNAIPEADGYVIYGNNCSQKTVKQIGVVTGKTLSWTQKKLKKNSQNHYIVKAYKVVDGKQYFIQTSNEIHLVTKGGKYTNVKKLKSSASKVTLKKGKKKALKIKQTYAEKNKTLVKHMKSLSYTTSDKTVATVTKKGVVKAKGKGSCYIFITANSGVYTKVKVTVK